MDIPYLLSVKYPGTKWSLNGDSFNYDCLNWIDESVSKPSLEELKNKWVECQKDYNWASIRSERNKKLIECDYTQLGDYNGLDKESWKTYRQALRSIPQVFGDPESVVWPVKPS